MMRGLHICLFLIFTNIVSAQLDFSLEPIPSTADSTADAEAFSAFAMIKNHSDETIVIAWERTLNDIPDGWQSYICSNITCAPPNVSMGIFSLTANDSTNLECYFVPDGVPGNGSVELRLFLTDDLSQEIITTYHGNASPVSALELFQEKIKIFPNPAIDHLTVQNESASFTEIYNSLGQLIQTQTSDNNLDISLLTKGSYFLKIYDLNKKLLSINKFQKVDSR